MESELGGKRRKYAGIDFGGALGGKLPKSHRILLWSCISIMVEMDCEKLDAFSWGFFYIYYTGHTNNAKPEAVIATLTAMTAEHEHETDTLLCRVRRRYSE